jgi:hypothetical protein
MALISLAAPLNDVRPSLLSEYFSCIAANLGFIDMNDEKVGRNDMASGNVSLDYFFK